ncbi:MAG TPA: CHRD domain-containing protein [Vicinamibacterales bacterium]|nr:CHRD domain-containing protein [Vicinamibacterales bacterium]
MKRVSAWIVALAFVAAGCGSSSTSPSSSTAANNPVFTATLLPSNEVPPIANAEASGSGTVQITMSVTKDASGNVTAANITFNATLSGFPAGTTVTLGHIHKAPAGVSGAVVISANVTSTTLANGSGSLLLTNGSPDVAVVQDILNNPSQYYFNLHSTLNPGGFARGQLSRVQ